MMRKIQDKYFFEVYFSKQIVQIESNVNWLPKILLLNCFWQLPISFYIKFGTK